jgi:hypothetical protein
MKSCSITTWRCRLLVLALLCVASVGCGDGSTRRQPVNATKAQEACKAFLKAWQDGKKSDDLKLEIIGADEAWRSGKKLVSFEILPNETNDGSSLQISVQLILKDDTGGESKSNVTYAVSTAPVVTVIRD